MARMTEDELKAAIEALPPMEPVKSAHTWAFWAWDLRQNILKHDPAEFLTWPSIVLTMFVGNAPYTEFELDTLISIFPANVRDGFLEAIKEPNFGKPVLCENTRITTSGNLIHQAYHLYQWEQKTGRQVKDLRTIVEIGGGYGAMAMIIRRLGFTGRYVIFDLPEFSLLQQYYLSNVGIGISEIELETSIWEKFHCDLLIGLYSLNEMSLKARRTIIGACPAKSYLIAYGGGWGGVDNMGWATELMRQRGELWHNWNIPHLPNCWYLIGDKRE